MQLSCKFVNTEKAENKATLRSDLNAVCRITRWRTATQVYSCRIQSFSDCMGFLTILILTNPVPSLFKTYMQNKSIADSL